MTKLKLKKNIFLILGIVAFFVLIICGLVIYYFISPVSKNYVEKNIIIEEGSAITDIASMLKEEHIIKNELVFKVFLKIKKVNNIYAAGYYLSPDMSLNEIVEVLKSGGHNENEITITFKEGVNITKIASVIANNTNNTEEDVYNVLKDQSYLKTLIEKYWFLEDDILNSSIYYPLEGYLFPDTYRISSIDASVSEIFKMMLDEMGEILGNYKADLEKSSYSVHEILTLASIVELEGLNDVSRKGIAGVFYNRLKEGMSLGSDVTTYYAFKIDMAERDLNQSEINTYNPYNTRGPKMIGKLPIGPICSPGKTSIEASIYPEDNDYLYFVADRKGNIYFTKTDSEHEKIISKLINEGLWYEW